MAEDSAEAQARTNIENESSVGQVLDSEQEKRRKKLRRAQITSLGVGIAGSLTVLAGRLAGVGLIFDIGIIVAILGGIASRIFFGATQLKSQEASNQEKNMQ